MQDSTDWHAGQNNKAIAWANAATNGAKQSHQPQPGHGLVGIHQMVPPEHTSDKQAYYSLIDPGRMKGWVGLVGWPVADGLPTIPHSGHPSAAGRAQDRVSLPAKDWRSANCATQWTINDCQWLTLLTHRQWIKQFQITQAAIHLPS